MFVFMERPSFLDLYLRF